VRLVSLELQVLRGPFEAVGAGEIAMGARLVELR
jgi:hypothetical protein